MLEILRDTSCSMHVIHFPKSMTRPPVIQTDEKGLEPFRQKQDIFQCKEEESIHRTFKLVLVCQGLGSMVASSSWNQQALGELLAVKRVVDIQDTQKLSPYLPGQ